MANDIAPEVEAARRRDASWVQAALDGDADAFAQLYDAWAARVYDLVSRIVTNRHLAQEVSQDVFFAAWRKLPELRDHEAFGGWLLRIARNTALNEVARNARVQPVGDAGNVERSGAGATAPASGSERLAATVDDPATVASNEELASLVREVALALDERDATVLDLQLRYEMTPSEIGETIGVNRNAANQLCHRARTRFATAFGARMLWKGNRPGCDLLASELAAAGVSRFGREAIRIADRHAETCARCEERRRTTLAPAALFGAVPIVAAPEVLRRIVTAPGALPSGVHGGASTRSSVSSSTGTAPPPPPRRPTMDVAHGDAALAAGSAGRSARVRVAAVAAAVLVLLALGVGGYLLSSSGSGSSNPAVARNVAPASSVPAGAPGESTAVSAAGGATTAAPATTRPGTTTTAPVTTARSLPLVQQLALSGRDALYGSWPLEPDGPLLSWQVTGATSVEVRMWFDDGVHGNRLLGVVSTAPSGSQRVCPGTSPQPGTCTAPNGYYTFVVSATNAAGTVTSSQSTPPGFHVYPPIG